MTAGCRRELASHGLTVARRAAAGICLGLCVSVHGAAAMDYPRDPDKTLAHVMETGRMSVAVTDNPPWTSVRADAPPTGVEVEMVTRFADDLHADIDWRHLSTFEALRALDEGEVDLAIGGFRSEDVVANDNAAPSYAYFDERIVVAMPDSGDAPQDLTGREVFVPPEILALGSLRAKGGVAAGAADETALVALPHWQLAQTGLRSTGILLLETGHVMAVRKGENAWLFRLEAFLRSQEHAVPALLRASQ